MLLLKRSHLLKPLFPTFAVPRFFSTNAPSYKTSGLKLNPKSSKTDKYRYYLLKSLGVGSTIRFTIPEATSIYNQQFLKTVCYQFKIDDIILLDPVPEDNVAPQLQYMKILQAKYKQASSSKKWLLGIVKSPYQAITKYGDENARIDFIIINCYDCYVVNLDYDQQRYDWKGYYEEMEGQLSNYLSCITQISLTRDSGSLDRHYHREEEDLYICKHCDRFEFFREKIASAYDVIIKNPANKSVYKSFQRMNAGKSLLL